MTPDAQAILRDWSPPLVLNLVLFLTALVYVRGWFRLHRAFPNLFSFARLAAFFGGVLSLILAIGSPLETFDDVSLSMHMVQHLLLMLVAPPLVLLGQPLVPLLRGLPRSIVRYAIGPLFRWAPIQALGRRITQPAFCWLAAGVMLIGWHMPVAFELALRSDAWHEVEHISFYATSLLFWWPVVLPFPSKAQWPRWSIPLYLFLGSLPGGALGAFLIFSDRVIYPSYASAPMLFRVAPFEDQVIAGALMWLFGSVAYLIPAVLITIQMLSPITLSVERVIRVGPRTVAGQRYAHSKAGAV
jgi:putative membrane protein